MRKLLLLMALATLSCGGLQSASTPSDKCDRVSAQLGSIAQWSGLVCTAFGVDSKDCGKVSRYADTSADLARVACGFVG